MLMWSSLCPPRCGTMQLYPPPCAPLTEQVGNQVEQTLLPYQATWRVLSPRTVPSFQESVCLGLGYCHWTWVIWSPLLGLTLSHQPQWLGFHHWGVECSCHSCSLHSQASSTNLWCWQECLQCHLCVEVGCSKWEVVEHPLCHPISPEKLGQNAQFMSSLVLTEGGPHHRPGVLEGGGFIFLT